MHFPKDLALEFDKVLFDIMRSQKEDLDSYKRYKFFDNYHDHQNFNLKKLEDYINNFKIPD